MNIKRIFISLTLRLAKIYPGLRRSLCKMWNLNTLSYWNEQYGDNSAKNKWGSQIRLQFYDLAASALPKVPATILDVGSGFGLGARHLMELYDGWDIHGLDFSIEACSKAVVKTHCIDLLTEPIPSGKYDYLLVIETLEHFSDPMPILKKIYNAAKKAVIVTVPYKGRISLTHPVAFDKNSFAEYPEVDTKVHNHMQVDDIMLVALKKPS